MMVARQRQRTSEDVLNRLRWDSSFELTDYALVYIDRILDEMMAIPAAEWYTIAEGGEIPWHRIVHIIHVGNDDEIVWSRLPESRCDKIFNSYVQQPV